MDGGGGCRGGGGGGATGARVSRRVTHFRKTRFRARPSICVVRRRAAAAQHRNVAVIDSHRRLLVLLPRPRFFRPPTWSQGRDACCSS